jgi:MFS transporter, PAT family, solute carrier family 33 (acetyl-CoA transportor), member 1
LGGTFPRYFILKFVDMFTVATCVPPVKAPRFDKLTGPIIMEPFSCVAEPERNRCIGGGGTCNIERDGYYIVNILCIIVGIVTFVSFIRPAALKLQALPLKAWRLPESG